jgi:hypothetical protein
MTPAGVTPEQHFDVSRCFSERFVGRVDRFAGLVSSGSSGQTSHGSPCDRADGTTQGRSDDRTGRRAAGGSHSGRNRLSTRSSCRIEHFTGLVSSRGSGHASHGSPYGRADGTTHDRAEHCAGRRTASGSHSGTKRMRTRLLHQVSGDVGIKRIRTRLLRQFSCFVHHERTSFGLYICNHG